MTVFVLSVSANGAVSGLQAKPGKGFDLRTLGNADIRRASEVLWDPAKQRWYVEIVRGKYAGSPITLSMLVRADGREPTFDGLDVTATFAEYDDAVAAEIKTLDWIRKTEGSSALS